MIIFLYGKDTFRSRQQLKKMVEKFKKDRDPQGYNVGIFDAQEVKDASVLLENILSMPFLAEKRMVVVENLLMSKNTELQKDILGRINENRIPETNVIIFWEGVGEFKGKDAKVLYERLSQEKFSQRFDELSGAVLGNWIKEEVETRGSKISSQAVLYLVNQIGGDMCIGQFGSEHL